VPITIQDASGDVLFNHHPHGAAAANDNLFLDYNSPAAPGYAVFGKVVGGIGVVDTIAAKPTGVAGGMPDVPLSEVSIVIAAQTR
jgi:cyclophilin family peptidyl-prolyl cis-trans isomerase